MREDEFAKRIEETMDWLGLTWHHETDSRKSKAGFPDYCIVGDYGVIFLEIKSSKGKVSPKQKEWIESLSRATLDDGVTKVVTAYVAYPEDWERVLSDLKRIAGRG